ncbi:MAG: phosphoglycerate kinase [Methanosarcinales archaeon]
MHKKEYLTLDDISVEGKTVLARLDLNSPMDPNGMILDDKRFKGHLPTLRELIHNNAKIVLLSHQSRPGRDDFTTMQPHANRLSYLLGKKVNYIDDIFGSNARTAIKNMKEGDVLLLENVRFYSEESLKRSAGEHARTHMVRKLLPYIDIYINDAFAVSHRPHLSILGFTKVLPSYAGRLMEKEIKSLSKGLHGDERPCIFVLGGTKVDDSLKVIDNVLSRGGADKVLVTGVVANVLLATKTKIGQKNIKFIEKQGYLDQVAFGKKLLEKHGNKIVLPKDVAVNNNGEREEIPVTELPTDLPIADIGIETIVSFSSIIQNAKIVIMNGPAGITESSEFSLGTSEVLQAATKSKFSVIGGGHIAAVVEQLNLEKKLSHVSTGGGACIDFLANGTLPGIDALKLGASIAD